MYELFKRIIIYKATKRTYEVLRLAVKQGEYTTYILVMAHTVFFCASGHKHPANGLTYLQNSYAHKYLCCFHCYYLSLLKYS